MKNEDNLEVGSLESQDIVDSDKSSKSKLPFVLLAILVIGVVTVVGLKYQNSKTEKQVPATMKPGPTVQWDMDMNESLSIITKRLMVLGEISGDAKVQECKTIADLLTQLSSTIPPAPDQGVQDSFATWIQSASNGVDSCAKKKESTDADLLTAADNFKAYIGKLNEARIKNS